MRISGTEPRQWSLDWKSSLKALTSDAPKVQNKLKPTGMVL